MAVLSVPAVPPWLLPLFGNNWPAVSAGIFALALIYPAWHVSYLGALIYHFFIASSPSNPTHLFSPMTRHARCLKDADINMHKSNSTYFADIDRSRNELVAHLTRHGFNACRRAGKLTFPRLGFVGCQFRREIPIGAKYDVSSRVLSWDEKWVYIVTHFTMGKGDGLKIAAVGLSKVVYKYGRVTMAPEDAFRESGLIPELEEEEKEKEKEKEKKKEKANGNANANSNGIGIGSSAKIAEMTNGAAEKRKNGRGPKVRDDSHPGHEYWTRERIEEERKRGMEIVEGMLNLEHLEGELRDGTETGLEEVKCRF